MIGREKPENVELFVDCLEALVETCLAPDNELEGSVGSSKNSTLNFGQQNNSSNTNINQSTTSFSNTVSSNYNLITGSMSSISMNSLHSPVEFYEFNELYRSNSNKIRRNSSPKNLM